MRKLISGALSFIGAATFALVACVGDDPISSSAPEGDGGRGEGTDDGSTPSTSDAGDEGGAAGPRMLSCAVVANPAPIEVGSATFPSAGSKGFDDERFAFVPLSDGKTVAIAALERRTGGVNDVVRIWTFDTTVGTPSVREAASFNAATRRVVWIGRVSDGIGVLEFGDELGSTYRYVVEKVTDLDLLAAGTRTERSGVSTSAPLPTQTLTSAQGAVAVALGMDDYFVIGTNTTQNGMTSKLVTARVSGNPTISETDLPPAVLLPGGIIPAEGVIHAFLATGDYPVLSPADHTFNPATAAKAQDPRPLPNDLMVASAKYDDGIATVFADGDWASGAANGIRIGTVKSLAGLDPSKLPLLPITLSDFGLSGELRFWTFAGKKPFLLSAGPRQSGPGVSFFFIEVDGTIRAAQRANGPNALLKDVPVVARADVVSVTAPALNPIFPMTWIARDAVQKKDTLFYGRVACEEAP